MASKSFQGGAAFPLGSHDADWGWPGFDFTVPGDWPSGVYLALCVEEGAQDSAGDINDPANRFAQALFVVRSAAPGSEACILYKVPLFTYQAYNELADPPSSLYTGPGLKVTMLRPGGGVGADPWDHVIPDEYDTVTFRQTFAHWDKKFIQWLEANNYAVDYCTDLDLHQNNSDLLSKYRLVLSVGHDEYWSKELRDHLETYIAAGGNLALFSGNVCWWRVHLTDNDTAFVCDKSTHQGIPGAFDQWWTGQNNRPENSVTGVSYRNAGGQWSGRREPLGYTVQYSGHWVYEGVLATNGGPIQDGDVFGDADTDTVVGYECDGAALAQQIGSQLLVPTTLDGTPGSFLVLGHAPVANWQDAEAGVASAATLGIYTRGGIVFTAATVDWARVLASGQSQVTQITRNVIDRLRSRAIRIYGLSGPCSSHLPVEGATVKFHVDVASFPNQVALSCQWTASAGTKGPVDKPTFSLQLPSPPVSVTVSVTIDDGTDCPGFGTLTFQVMSYQEAALANFLCALRHMLGVRPRRLIQGVGEGNGFFVDPLWDPIRGFVGAVLDRQQVSQIVREARRVTELGEHLLHEER